MTKLEVKISPMLRRRIEAALGREINPVDEGTINRLDKISESVFHDIKKIAEQEDQIMAERYFKFLASPEIYPYVFGYLVEVILNGENSLDWIRDNVISK